jgi:hypothetical protein
MPKLVHGDFSAMPFSGSAAIGSGRQGVLRDSKKSE